MMGIRDVGRFIASKASEKNKGPSGVCPYTKACHTFWYVRGPLQPAVIKEIILWKFRKSSPLESKISSLMMASGSLHVPILRGHCRHDVFCAFCGWNRSATILGGLCWDLVRDALWILWWSFGLGGGGVRIWFCAVERGVAAARCAAARTLGFMGSTKLRFCRTVGIIGKKSFRLCRGLNDTAI